MKHTLNKEIGKECEEYELELASSVEFAGGNGI